MKAHFIEAKAKIQVEIPEDIIKKLPTHLGIVSSVQFLNQQEKIQQQLEKHGKKTNLVKGKHSKHQGQIVGCSYPELKYDENTEAFLYIGDGLFHPEALLIGTNKDTYLYDPFIKKIKLLTREKINKIKKTEKAAILHFLNATKIGVLITTKPGQITVQTQLQEIFKLEKKYPNKKFYYLTFNTLDFNQLENFPFIQVFINTACNRLIDDYSKFPKPMININEVNKIQK